MKTTFLVVAALGAAIVSTSAADASVRYRQTAAGTRHSIAYRHIAVRSGYSLPRRIGLRGTRASGRTEASRQTSLHTAYSRHRLRSAQSYGVRGYGVRGLGARGLGAGHYAVRGHGYRLAHRDAMIRRYVGPRTAYAPTTTSGGEGTSVGYSVQTGAASYYSGGRTANGGSVGAATCAHRSLPFGTRVLVTNLANAHRMVLTVNDRGPFIAGRIIDVSTTAAASLGMLHSGTAPVTVQVVGAHG